MDTAVTALSDSGLIQAREAVRDTIYRATISLDAQKWQDWLALCDSNLAYEIKSWSPEINKDVTYKRADYEALETEIKLLPKHNTDHSRLTRHTSVYTVDIADDGGHANAVSAFLVYRHLLDSGADSHISAGESELFLVGKYYDELVLEHGQARFTHRTVRLEERRLDRGSHWLI